MVESTRRATSGVVAWLKESICWLKAKKAPAAARAIARCHHEGPTRPSLSSESESWRLEKSPTPSRARIKNGIWSRTRSPRLSGGWALALARTSVNEIDAMSTPNRITERESASACTGLWESIGKTLAIRLRTGQEATAAARSPVAMTVRSSARCMSTLGADDSTRAPARSAVPSRQIRPPITPPRTSAARFAQRLPTAALAVMIRGRGVSSTTAVAASSGRNPVSRSSVPCRAGAWPAPRRPRTCRTRSAA